MTRRQVYIRHYICISIYTYMPPKTRSQTRGRTRSRSRTRSPVRPPDPTFLNIVPYKSSEYAFIHFMYGPGFEGRLETRTRPIVILETPDGSWPTANIAFYKSTGTSNENSDYRSGTWFPTYGFGMSPREVDASTGTPLMDKLGQPYTPKFLKMMDYKPPSGFPVIVEIDQLRVSFYHWLIQKGVPRARNDIIIDEVFNKVVYLYFANIWQIKTSICLSLKRDLRLSEFEDNRNNVEWLNAVFDDNCVWKSTTNDVNFLDFVHFFLLVVGDIPAYPEIVQNINHVYDKKQKVYLRKWAKGTLDERDINDAELIRVLNENRAQMPFDVLTNPNTYLRFRRFYMAATALQLFGNELGPVSYKKGGRKTYRKKRCGGLS